MQSMSKTKSNSKRRSQLGQKKTKKVIKDQELIVIDENKGLIFEDEETLFKYFDSAIVKVETIYDQNRQKSDFTDEEQLSLEKYMEQALDQPDQIWKDETLTEEFPIFYFFKKIKLPKQEFTYICICYLEQEELVPTFVLSHFPTKDQAMIKKYQTQELIYDVQFEKVKDASVEGDALGEGDTLAFGLFRSMMILRTEKDIPQSDFSQFADLREECIENPDEIWKKTDGEGHSLVTFVKEFSEHSTKDLFYLAVTLEEPESQVHTLLFSFPTTDSSLVDRYRQGENLQAEEIVQESSH